MSGGAVGAMVLPPLAEALIQRVGWRGACVALGAIVLLLGVPVVGAFVRNRDAMPRAHDGQVSGATVRVALVWWDV